MPPAGHISAVYGSGSSVQPEVGRLWLGSHQGNKVGGTCPVWLWGPVINHRQHSGDGRGSVHRRGLDRGREFRDPHYHGLFCIFNKCCSFAVDEYGVP